jgi:hypothetical protein
MNVSAPESPAQTNDRTALRLESKMNQKPIVKKIGILCAVALGVALPLVSSAGDYRDSYRDGDNRRHAAIEGVWDTTVTITTCDTNITIRTFRGTNLFEEDGSNVATSVAAPTPTLGRWRYLGGRKYSAIGRFFRYDLSGVFQGWTQLSRAIDMKPDGQSFTSVVKTELFDIFDNPVGTSCGTELSKRIY